MRRRLHCIVRGRVHGVWFRGATQIEASRLGVTGWVRNRPDDTVEIVAEGSDEELDVLLAFARRGPRAARVDGVEVNWQDADGSFDTFSVLD